MITDLSSNMQLGTQGYNRRPYGVGLLVAGFDDKGPHIFQVGSDFYFQQSYFIINFVFKRWEMITYKKQLQLMKQNKSFE